MLVKYIVSLRNIRVIMALLFDRAAAKGVRVIYGESGIGKSTLMKQWFREALVIEGKDLEAMVLQTIRAGRLVSEPKNKVIILDHVLSMNRLEAVIEPLRKDHFVYVLLDPSQHSKLVPLYKCTKLHPTPVTARVVRKLGKGHEITKQEARFIRNTCINVMQVKRAIHRLEIRKKVHIHEDLSNDEI